MNNRGVFLLLFSTFVSILYPHYVFATQYNVQIDTSAIQGGEGAIAFDYTSNTQGDNTAVILNFSHDGTTDLPETQGGLVQGDIILLLNPAPFTEIRDGSFFNELLVPFTAFGTAISFTVQITENSPPSGQLPDEFSFFILGANRQVLFSSADPLGADSLFAICVDGTPTGLLNPFNPTVFTPPNLLEILASGRPSNDSDGDGIPDTDDACPNSDLNPTVVVDSCGSGVNNMLSTNGCTISDEIAKCANNANNHGQFTSCVTQLTNQFVSNQQSQQVSGGISGNDKGSIQSCAARANIP